MQQRRQATVVVLGDLARSPRTLYHVISLLRSGFDVDVVCYLDTPLPRALARDPGLALRPLRTQLRNASLLTLVQITLELANVLIWHVRRPGWVVVQNPPGLPVLPVAWVAARVRSSRLLVDWHNLTSAMLALKMRDTHPFVRITRWLEAAIGRRADANLFVTAAMKSALATRWGLDGAVFEDQPICVKPRLAPRMRERVRQFVQHETQAPLTDAPYGLVVSPTSWTADEDFDLLVQAIDACDARVADHIDRGGQFPHVLVLLTGKGPLRDAYERRFQARATCRVHVRTLWLESACYPRVLRAADVGLCLHRSASGLDFPMKIVDFLGARLPVLALNYGPSIEQRLENQQGARLFRTADELATLLFARFASENVASPAHADAPARTWQSEWGACVLPLLVTPRT